MDLIAALRSEEARLEAALRAVPVYRQLEAVRAALGPLTAAYAVADAEPYKNIVTPARAPQSSGITGAANRLAEAEMRRTGRRLASSLMLPMLAAEGIIVPGKNPQAAVASALSANKRMFDNKRDERGVGYGLVEWTHPSASPEVTSVLPMAPEATSSPGGEAPTGGSRPPASFTDTTSGQQLEGDHRLNNDPGVGGI